MLKASFTLGYLSSTRSSAPDSSFLNCRSWETWWWLRELSSCHSMGDLNCILSAWLGPALIPVFKYLRNEPADGTILSRSLSLSLSLPHPQGPPITNKSLKALKDLFIWNAKFYIEKGRRKRCPIRWFIPWMTAKARAEQVQSLEPWYFWISHRVPRHLEHPPLLSQSH